MHKTHSEKIEKFSHIAAKWAGSEHGFITAMASLLVWVIAGAFVGYSQVWQNLLEIYIGIITFLMLFVLQRAQNKELLAVHVKLNELIVSTQGANNDFVKVEELTEKEITLAHQTHGEATPQHAE